MSKQPTPQIGGSDRGPAQLDEAQKNLGTGSPGGTGKGSANEGLSSGRTAGAEEEAARKGVERTSEPVAPSPITERKKL